MRQEKTSLGKYIRWSEVTYWLLAIMLLWYTWSGGIAPQAPMSWLYALTIGIGLVPSIVFRLLPHESRQGMLRYQAEDKFLLTSLAVVGLLTAYLYLTVGMATSIEYVYFVPVLLSTLLLNESVVLAETSLAMMAMSLCQATLEPAGLTSQPFILRLAVLGLAGLIGFNLASELRQRTTRSENLLRELSQRLDQIQAVSIIVKQVEFFTQVEKLVQRVAESLTGAFGAEFSGIYLVDGRNGLKLSAAYRMSAMPCSGQCKGGEIPAGLGELADCELLHDALKADRCRLVAAAEAAAAGFKFLPEGELLLAPLRVRERPIGVIFVANKSVGSFTPADASFFDTLGGYVATLVDSSLSYQAVSDEREKAEKALKIMVARELRMRELKQQISQSSSPDEGL